MVPYREKFADNARTKYDKDLAAIVLADKPDLVVCAGYMNILADTFLDPLTEANVLIINLHPALPVCFHCFPLSSSLRIKLDQAQFNGAKAIERAHKAWLDGKIQVTGVFVHYVISEVDMGEPILVSKHLLPSSMTTKYLPYIEIGRRDTLHQRRRRGHWEIGAKNPREGA